MLTRSPAMGDLVKSFNFLDKKRRIEWYQNAQKIFSNLCIFFSKKYWQNRFSVIQYRQDKERKILNTRKGKHMTTIKNFIGGILLLVLGFVITFVLSTGTCFFLSRFLPFDFTLPNILRTTLLYFTIVFIKSFIKTIVKMKNQSKDWFFFFFNLLKFLTKWLLSIIDKNY